MLQPLFMHNKTSIRRVHDYFFMYGYDKKTDSAFHIFVGPLSITGSVVRQEKKKQNSANRISNKNSV